LWWDAPFYEGSSTQYSTFVPHDLPGLVDLLGGKASATAWLDRIFDQNLYTQGNEPDLLAPYTYVYTGRQDRTAERVRSILAKEYHTGRAGLPGNDDAGTMSSWLVWSSIGIYPLAGQPLYLTGTPVFTHVRVQVGQGRSFQINAPASSPVNLYVQSAELNGQTIHRAWLTHSELTAGGTLLLNMGPTPSPWDTEAPPGGVQAWNLVPR
jgi:putative alpha-1,2-mannosidase